MMRDNLDEPRLPVCKQESTLLVLALFPNTVVASLVQRFLYQLVGRI